MTKDKELKALFVMCSDLKAQVKALSEEVKALREARTAPEKILESIHQINEDITYTGKYAEKHITRLGADIEEIREHVQEHEEWRKAAIKRVVAIEDNVLKGKANYVRSNMPERFQQRQHQRPVHIRQRRERVCYNCRKPGHEARQCQKPNPRNQNLSAPDNSKPTLSGILKKKLPENNSVEKSEPESNEQAQSLSVGAYQPRISLNPRLAGYDMNKLGIHVTPYQSEATKPPEW